MKTHYDLLTQISYYGLIPSNIRIESECVTGSLDRQFFEKMGRWLQLGNGEVEWAAKEPFPVGRWKDPPHVALANLHLEDLAAVCKFTRDYGFVTEKPREGTFRYPVSLPELRRRQELVRDAWLGGEKAKLLAEELELPNPHLSLHIGDKQSELAVNHLWTLIEILVLRDVAAKNTRICASSDCPARFFLPVRRGQKFCSHNCAILVNVRRFRQRQKKAMKLLEATEQEQARSRTNRRKQQ